MRLTKIKIMKLLYIISLVIILTAIETMPAFALSAADSTVTTAISGKVVEPAVGKFNVAVSVFRMITGLILVVGAVILVVWGLKWLQNKRIGRGIPEWIKTIGIFPLGPKQHLYMVKMLDRYMLLGVTESNINIISELDEEEAKAIKAEENLPNTFGNTLARQMNILAKRKNK